VSLEWFQTLLTGDFLGSPPLFDPFSIFLSLFSILSPHVPSFIYTLILIVSDTQTHFCFQQTFILVLDVYVIIILKWINFKLVSIFIYYFYSFYKKNTWFFRFIVSFFRKNCSENISLILGENNFWLNFIYCAVEFWIIRYPFL
jgi:hypothetical protein